MNLTITQTDQKQRSSIIARLNDAHAKVLADIPALDAAVERAQLEAKKAEDSLKAAMLHLAKAVNARSSVVQQLEYARTQARPFLQSTAPASLVAFLEEVRNELNRLRAGRVHTSERLTGRIDPRSTKSERELFSDERSRTARMSALVAIVQSADELRAAVATESDALERIAQLRASLPEIKLESVGLTTA